MLTWINKYSFIDVPWRKIHLYSVAHSVATRTNQESVTRTKLIWLVEDYSRNIHICSNTGKKMPKSFLQLLFYGNLKLKVCWDNKKIFYIEAIKVMMCVYSHNDVWEDNWFLKLPWPPIKFSHLNIFINIVEDCTRIFL